MTPTTKKIISLTLIALLLVASISLATPPKIAHAASSITATATPGTQSGVPGSTLTFTINLVNQDASNPFDLTSVASSSPNNWANITPYPATVQIAASGSASMVVTVPIPTTATAGTTEIVMLNLSVGVDTVASVPMVVNVVAPGADMRRPQLGVNSFSYGDKRVTAGTEFELALVIDNRGQISAFNNTVTFSGEGFFPIGTGGMQSIQNIEPGGKITFYQKFLVSDDLWWSEAGTITVAAQYSDAAGTIYNNTFSLTIPLAYSYASAATATPKASNRPQLVITGNSTDIDPLQPGSIFELNLDVMNLGNSDAKSVIMVLGGGASTVNDLGTPQASTGGSGADLTNFAPLGSSNVIVVGDIAKGASTSIKQKLVVNVSTVPGAYTLKTSFVYTDVNGTKYVDDQVITLLVYSLPQVEINFYRDPGVLMVGMPGTLPLQVTNLGKKTSVLGNMKVTSTDAEITNNVSLVGALESGGYYTLDADVIPVQEGTLNIDVTINYTDDFNQPREIVQTIQVEVMAEPVMTPDPMMNPEMPVEPVVETFWSKVGRFFKGLFGLDSSAPEPAPMPGFEEMPAENDMPVVIAPKG